MGNWIVRIVHILIRVIKLPPLPRSESIVSYWFLHPTNALLGAKMPPTGLIGRTPAAFPEAAAWYRITRCSDSQPPTIRTWFVNPFHTSQQRSYSRVDVVFHPGRNSMGIPWLRRIELRIHWENESCFLMCRGELLPVQSPQFTGKCMHPWA